jgi:hypothetical protein
MIIKTLTRGQAQEAMQNWVENFPALPEIDSDFYQLRADLQAINNTVREEINNKPDIKRTDYYLDYRFGLLLYEYLNRQQGFSLRVAANDGFWRFLSVQIAPDVVAQRWGKDNDSHFWSQPIRNWFRSLWWFVYLAWQGDLESTDALLSCPHFTTDTILNFEERTGRKGTHVEAYREIIKCYAAVPPEILKKSRGKNSDDLFRVVMKLNTARMLVMDPALYLGGEEAYAKSLFFDAGVDLDAT